MLPVFRVNSGGAWVWDGTPGKQSERAEWAPYAINSHLLEALRLSATSQSVEVAGEWPGTYQVAGFELRNKFDEGGVRPSNVSVPGSQMVIIHMFYGPRPIDLPVTVSYTLNASYPGQPPC
jgi:hypothetical protein